MKPYRHKKEKAAGLPRIKRFFTEDFKILFPRLSHVKIFKFYRESLKIFTILILAIALIIVGFDLVKNLEEKKEIDLQRGNMTNELKFWKEVLATRKDYRDGYFQASILEYRLGNKEQARKYLIQGLVLDPNSEDGKKLEKFLVNK